MKKHLPIIAFLLTAIMLFTGYGCAGCNVETYYSGKFNWQRNDTYSPTFKETCIYDVVYRDDFEVITENSGVFDYKKTAKFTDDFSITYETGSYTVTVEAITKSSLPERSAETGSNELYKLTTSLTIPVNYVINGNGYSFTDTITSAVYFESITTSLCPLYSIKNYDTTYVGTSKKIFRNAYSTEIIWGNTAHLNLTDNSNNIVSTYEPNDDYEILTATAISKDISYSRRCTLDNEELLFALRAFDNLETGLVPLNIIDTAYALVQGVQSDTVMTANVLDPWTLTINGNVETSKNSGTNTELVAVSRTDTTYRGTSSLCYYQRSNDDSVSAKRFYLIKMVNVLPSGVGALEYKLTSVNVIE